MPGLNIHTSYGRMLADAIASRKPNTGRVYFVATTGVAGWDELSSMFPTGPEGNTRVFTTLKGLLDASVIRNNGDDVVYVAANHTETIRTAAAINFSSVNGLTVVGLGEADERPLFTWASATGADMEVDSNGVTIENCRFDMTGVDALTGPIDVDSTGFTLRNCEINHADGSGQAVVVIVTDANASGLTVEGCEFIGSKDAGTVSAIRIVGGNDHRIRNNHFNGAYRTHGGAIQVTTTAAGNVLIEGNTILNKTASSVSAVDFVKNCTAVIVGNVFGVRSGTTPITVSQDTQTGQDGGYLLVGRNYFRAATAPVAGTLL